MIIMINNEMIIYAQPEEFRYITYPGIRPNLNRDMEMSIYMKFYMVIEIIKIIMQYIN